MACSKGRYQDAKFVFVDAVNNTGWPSKGIAFIIGLVNPAWAFSCLDSVTHLSEETPQPERDVPKLSCQRLLLGLLHHSLLLLPCFSVSMIWNKL